MDVSAACPAQVESLTESFCKLDEVVVRVVRAEVERHGKPTTPFP